MVRGAVAAAASGGLAAALDACAGEAAPPEPAAPVLRPDGGPATPARAPVRPGTPPAPAPLPPGLPPEIVHGPRDRLLVALTFHGQGDPALAGALLAEAERAGARVTVLAVGTWLDAYPRMAHRVLDGGHELGNHTQHHADVSAMGADAVHAEIAACADRLRRLTGSPGRWFRPSRARHATPLVLRQARRAGYAHCLSYDLDPLDHTDPGPEAVAHAVLSAVRGGSVVSLHLGHPGTVAALPAVLDGLHRRGLRAVTTTEMLTP
ncbi:polysaccharide deacetylase family protein [Streptacidiphilus sp. ASG 303]|uniref:polysaccharide deacetylase family protein n=1 Tax=Streptacidiphilus sp. ASG 303 TaxID=2896847 RepID=UPI001E43490F|nr:polysaccharide deacetylase family protein [Streptacidiphilus sp. ASG 303]MCD0485181.1 polysaccharide deacetylase family protein [Streptacidiphilus sp. ASG 303]